MAQSLSLENKIYLSTKQMDNGNVTCNEPVTHSQWEYSINGVTTACFVCFGLIGSFYCACILVRRLNHSRFSKYLFALCIWDAAVLIAVFGFYGGPTVVTGSLPWNGPYVTFYRIFYPLINMTMAGSKWMVLAVTFERYLAMARPFKQRIREQKSVKHILASLPIAVVITNLPLCFELKITSCYSEKEYEYKQQIDTSPLREDKTYNLVYRVIISLILESILPLLLVFLLTIRLILILPKRQLRGTSTKILLEEQSLKRKRSTQINLAKETKRTALLISVTIKFLACYSLPTIINILEFTNIYRNNYTVFNKIIDISNLLVVIHSATNWIIFCEWRLKTPLSLQRNLTSRSAIEISREERELLKNIWSNQDTDKLGVDLMWQLIEQNKSLISWYFGANNSEGNIEDEQFQERIRQMGQRVGSFLNQIIEDIVEESVDLTEIGQRLRMVGKQHFLLHINLHNKEWHTMKRFLMERLTTNNDEGRKAVNKFVSYIIYELKIGFLCKAVEEYGSLTMTTFTQN